MVLKMLADDPKSGQILKETQSVVEHGIFVLHSKVDQTSVSIFSNAFWTPIVLLMPVSASRMLQVLNWCIENALN